jgi:2-polyprenyl-6-methoxyphenol hydroxylase-like FAD-dependent oxidoreductase
VLQAGGQQVLLRMFPGLKQDLLAAGATELDVARDLMWFHLGAYGVRYESGITQLAMSRPLLESQVRRRVRNNPKVVCLDGCEVVDWELDPSGARIAAVRVRQRDAGSPETRLEANLVIDATGRGSRTPKWLEAQGFGRVQASTVDIGYGYASRLYRREPRLLPEATALYVMPTPPDDKRLGGLFPIEGGRWIVTLGGYAGAHAPTDEAGFLAHARALGAPELSRVLQEAEPLSEVVVHKVPSNLRRHYERMRRLPTNLLVMGDAMCSFNPIYGQGMTVSALEAELLDRCLRRSETGGSTLAPRFLKAAAKVVDDAWTVTVGEDFRYAGVTGIKPPLVDWINAYVTQVHKASHVDPITAQAFLEVLSLLRRPTSLFHPRVVARVLQQRLRKSPSAPRLAPTSAI